MNLDQTPAPLAEYSNEDNRISMNYSTQVVQPILMASLAAAFASLPLPLLDSFWLDRAWLWLIIPIFLISLEGVYTTHWLYKPRQRTISRTVYRLCEITIIMVIARIAGWLVGDIWPDFSNGEFLFNPGVLIFDPFILVTVPLFMLAWVRSLIVARLFFGLSPEGAHYSVSDLLPTGQQQYDFAPMQTRTVYWDNYVNHWIWGGVFVILAVALSTVDFPNLPDTGVRSITRLSMPPAMLWLTLIYFVSGFALMSQGRLALLHIRWSRRNANKAEQVERIWIRQALWTLLAVGGIASFLPIGSSFFLSQMIQSALFGVFQLASYLVFLLIQFMAWLFPDRPPDPYLEELAAQPFSPVLTPPPADLPPPAEAVEPTPYAGAFFWFVVLLVIGLAILYFVQNRNIPFGQSYAAKLWRSLLTWWQSLWGNVSRRTAELRDVVITQFVRDEDEDGKKQPSWRFIRVNSLSPRQKLRYFYLSTMQRAEQRGRVRDDSDTPIEYSGDLKEGWPTADQEIDQVTAGFLKARYSPNEITEEEAAEIQAHWKELRSQLKRKVKKAEAKPDDADAPSGESDETSGESDE